MDTYNALILLCVLALFILVAISVVLWIKERRRARNTIKSVTLYDTMIVPIRDGNQTTWVEVPR